VDYSSVCIQAIHFVLLACFSTFEKKKTQKYKPFWEEVIPYFLSYDTGRIENEASNNSSTVACVFGATVTISPRRFLATIGGYT
jgi:hypothetical protein